MQKNAQDGYILFSWECNFYTDETLSYDIRRESNGFVKIDEVEKDCTVLLEAGAITGAVEIPRELSFDGLAKKHFEKHLEARVRKTRTIKRYFLYSQGNELRSFSYNVKTIAWCSPRFNRADFRSKIKNTRFLTAVSIIPVSHIWHLDEDTQLRIWQFIRTNNRGDLAELAEIFETLDYGRKRYGIVFNPEDNKAVIIFPPIENGSKEEAKAIRPEFKKMFPFLDQIKDISPRGKKETDNFTRCPDDLKQRVKSGSKYDDLHPDFDFGFCKRGAEYIFWVRRKKDRYPYWRLKEQ